MTLPHTLEKIVDAMGDATRVMRGWMEQVDLQITDPVDVPGDYTTVGSQLLICENASPINITLNTAAVNGETVIVKRKGALITIIGAIDGSTSLTLPALYDGVQLVHYNGEWSII